MITAIIEAFGYCLGYVLVISCVSVVWDIVTRAFTRGY